MSSIEYRVQYNLLLSYIYEMKQALVVKMTQSSGSLAKLEIITRILRIEDNSQKQVARAVVSVDACTIKAYLVSSSNHVPSDTEHLPGMSRGD